MEKQDRAPGDRLREAKESLGRPSDGRVLLRVRVVLDEPAQTAKAVSCLAPDRTTSGGLAPLPLGRVHPTSTSLKADGTTNDWTDLAPAGDWHVTGEDAFRLSLWCDRAVLFASIRRRCGALRSETPTTRKGEWGVPTVADVAVSTLRASGVRRVYEFAGIRGAGDESRRNRHTPPIWTTQTSPTSRERSGCTACGLSARINSRPRPVARSFTMARR